MLSGTEAAPYVDATGSYRAGQCTILAYVSGPASKPSLELSSEPHLEQADILAVLLFGKPAAELSSGQASGLQQQTLRLAGGYAIGELGTSVRDMLGLDALDVEAPQGSTGTGRVSVGRYIARDVFVSFAQEFGSSIAEVVGIEYAITRRFSIRGSTSTRGNTAVDLFWSRRY